MNKITAMDKISVLMCAPGQKCEGGISAVVYGLVDGLLGLGTIYCTRIVYAKPYENLSSFSRVFHELIQCINYLFKLLLLRPDIVHVQSSFDKKTILRDVLYLFVAKLFRCNFILHAHGGAWHQRPAWSSAWKWCSKIFLESCSVVLVTSSEEQAQIREISTGIKVAKIDNPVQAPVDISTIPRNPVGQATNNFKLVFASRHIEAKGLLDTIKAFTLLNRTDCELHIFGDGPLTETAKNLSKDFDIEARIQFHGNVSLDTLITKYLNSDVYIFPSYHHEGFPMSLFFAAACSLPIICTKVRPLPDFFTEPHNCMWVEPRNPEMIADKLNHLLNNAELLASMSVHNQKLVDRFDPHKIALELESIYLGLIKI